MRVWKELLWALVAAALLSLLEFVLKHEHPVLWWLAVLSFAVGVFLIIHVKEDTTRASLLLFAPLAFLSFACFFAFSGSSACSYDVLEYSSINWNKLMKRADTQVLAEGMVLEAIDVDVLVEALRRTDSLNVTVVLLDPEGLVVAQRAADESLAAPPENRARLIEKIRRIQVARADPASERWRERFQVLVRDTYPTMAVIAVDDDLYAYFYSFRKRGTQSPVFRFSKYKRDPFAHFFEEHLRSSFDPKQGAHAPRDYTK